MGKPIDITGKRFGRLVAVKQSSPDGNKRTRWLVRCDCGAEKVVDGAHMRYGRIKSCGCWGKEVRSKTARKHLSRFAGHNKSHGMSQTAVYAVWKAMLDRCRNPNNKDYHYYGGRGVSVCDRWKVFENFYTDMGDPNGLTLDRINTDGDYAPDNCRWATWFEQRHNRRENGRARDNHSIRL